MSSCLNSPAGLIVNIREIGIPTALYAYASLGLFPYPAKKGFFPSNSDWMSFKHLILNSSGFLSMTSLLKAWIKESGLRKRGPSGRQTSPCFRDCRYSLVMDAWPIALGKWKELGKAYYYYYYYYYCFVGEQHA